VSSSLRRRQAQQLFKTEMCKFFMQGRCDSGDNCSYAHSPSDLRIKPNLEKTSKCKNIIKFGVCNDESCRFAHTEEELRATHGFFKMKMCGFVSSGRCKRGAACRFAHSKTEMRPPKQEKHSDGQQNLASIAEDGLRTPVGPIAQLQTNNETQALLNMKCEDQALATRIGEVPFHMQVPSPTDDEVASPIPPYRQFPQHDEQLTSSVPFHLQLQPRKEPGSSIPNTRVPQLRSRKDGPDLQQLDAERPYCRQSPLPGNVQRPELEFGVPMMSFHGMNPYQDEMSYQGDFLDSPWGSDTEREPAHKQVFGFRERMQHDELRQIPADPHAAEAWVTAQQRGAGAREMGPARMPFDEHQGTVSASAMSRPAMDFGKPMPSRRQRKRGRRPNSDVQVPFQINAQVRQDHRAPGPAGPDDSRFPISGPHPDPHGQWADLSQMSTSREQLSSQPRHCEPADSPQAHQDGFQGQMMQVYAPMVPVAQIPWTGASEDLPRGFNSEVMPYVVLMPQPLPSAQKFAQDGARGGKPSTYQPQQSSEHHMPTMPVPNVDWVRSWGA